MQTNRRVRRIDQGRRTYGDRQGAEQHESAQRRSRVHMNEERASKKNAMDRHITMRATFDVMPDFTECENAPRADFCLAVRGN
jgi:hypothetical protein